MHSASAMTPDQLFLIDNGGRRLTGERRIYTYNGHLPERRRGRERRLHGDRRKKPRFCYPA